MKRPSLSHLIATISLLIGISGLSVARAETTPLKGKVFNPDISANFLGLLRRGSDLPNEFTQANRNGLTLQEAEIQFFSDVDTYLRAVALFSISQEEDSTAYGIDPEEVYVETLNLPRVTLRAGKMKLGLGKHNLLHTHAFPFIDAPLIHTELLGDEGLNEVAVSAAGLLPTSWFSELTLQTFNPSNATLFVPTGNSPPSGSLGIVGHWKNLFDLNDDTTLEIGASGMTGKNTERRNSTVAAADLTLKWRPSEGGKYHAFIWGTEYLSGQRAGRVDSTSGESTARLSGLATWVQYQFAERWWVQARGEVLGLAHSPAIEKKNRQSTLIGFFPSEFSGFRFQLDRERNIATAKTDYTGSLQYNVTIGAHPAHAY